MHPDNVYHDRVVKISEPADPQGKLDSFGFTGCEIKGPAILALRDSRVTGCSFRDPLDQMLWEVPPSRPRVVGVMWVSNCIFDQCTFENIGFTGSPNAMDEFRSGIDNA